MRFQQNLLALAIVFTTGTAAFSQMAAPAKAVSTTKPAAAVAAKPVTTEPTKEEIMAKLTVGTWHIAYLSNGVKKKNVDPDDSDENWTAFKKDGTFRSADGGDESTGKWSYNHVTKTITTNDKDGVTNFKLISITAKELAVGTEMDGKPITMGMMNR